MSKLINFLVYSFKQCRKYLFSCYIILDG